MHYSTVKTGPYFCILYFSLKREVKKMKRTTAEANDGNRYTEGNPALGIPATVVGAEEMNNIQEEIVNVVLDAGLTLNGSDEDQLLEALQIIFGRGVTQYSQAIVNNQAAGLDITGVVFDKTEIKAARLLFDIFRRDDAQDKNESGEIYVYHNTETDTWAVQHFSVGDDAEVEFAILSSGQLQYTSSNFAGGNHAGTLRITEITTLAQ